MAFVDYWKEFVEDLFFSTELQHGLLRHILEQKETSFELGVNHFADVISSQLIRCITPVAFLLLDTFSKGSGHWLSHTGTLQILLFLILWRCKSGHRWLRWKLNIFNWLCWLLLPQKLLDFVPLVLHQVFEFDHDSDKSLPLGFCEPCIVEVLQAKAT